ncbi:MAG: hypothetical protein AB1782_19435 [Cyanobacteriota bacterium]
MKTQKCPDCKNEIPDYRLEDPYCDCGWQLNRGSSSHDELNWIIAVVAAVIVCAVQIVILFILHFASSYALSFLANIFAQYVTYETITLLHWFIILSIDFIVLAGLYFSICYWLAKKSSYPILLTMVFGFIVVPFKLFVIDPRSNIVYPMFAYIMDIMLIMVTISAGVLARYKSQIKKELSSIEKNESPENVYE